MKLFLAGNFGLFSFNISIAGAVSYVVGIALIPEAVQMNPQKLQPNPRGFEPLKAHVWSSVADDHAGNHVTFNRKRTLFFNGSW